MKINPYNKKTLFSFEVFPPKDDIALNAIYLNMGCFAALKPDYISVTYGAGGSQIGASLEISSFIQSQYNILSMAHLTCAGNTKAEIDATINRFRAAGINNILALRGDLKEGRAVSDFPHAEDLIGYLNTLGGFDIAAACYPEGHPESPDFDFDFDVVKRKNDLGVNRFISQLFFDNTDFYTMVDKARSRGVNAVFEAGIMPITNIRQITKTVGFSGAKLPSKLTKFVSRYENNPVAFRQAGINFTLEQISDLLSEGVDGIHLYVMNSPKTATEIISGVSALLEEANR